MDTVPFNCHPEPFNCHPERSEGSKILAISGVSLTRTLDSVLRSE